MKSWSLNMTVTAVSRQEAELTLFLYMHTKEIAESLGKCMLIEKILPSDRKLMYKTAVYTLVNGVITSKTANIKKCGAVAPERILGAHVRCKAPENFLLFPFTFWRGTPHCSGGHAFAVLCLKLVNYC